jgi:hypothetical protein
MSVRVPAIIDGVVERNSDYSPAIRESLLRLRDTLANGAPLPALKSGAPGADEWRAGLARRKGEGWLSTDWFFAETYAYRTLVEAVRYWETHRDPFLPTKRDEYASDAHAEALDRALALELEGSTEERLHALFGLALFGNRIDLSFAASRAHGTATQADDILADDRNAAVETTLRREGPFTIVCDNAGTELTLDLVLADFVLRELGAPVVLHLKEHPTFVSDATIADVLSFLGLEGDRSFSPRSKPSLAFVERLRTATQSRRLLVASHPFWNGPASLFDLPETLANELETARLVVSKGDANYRRALNDALWAPETPFADATSYFPSPLLALRTLKSDTIVGLAVGRATELDRADPTWRVNGKRGVASLGGQSIR